MDFVARVLSLFDRYDIHDLLFWRTGKRYGGGEFANPASFFVNCNDVFCWGTADLEEITPENIEVLEASLADCKAIDRVTGAIEAPHLFVARVRKMRPQGAMYPHINPALWPLFDACGPEREVNCGNPKRQPAPPAAKESP